MVKVEYKRRRTVAIPADMFRCQPETWEQQSCLLHPHTGEQIFGTVSELTLGRTQLAPAAPIFLRCGNKAFGFFHAWKEHFRHHTAQEQAAEEIAKFVAGMLKPQTEVRYAADEQSDNLKAKVVRVNTGLVILEYRPEEGAYSVVTAGPFWKNTKGSVVGALV